VEGRRAMRRALAVALLVAATAATRSSAAADRSTPSPDDVKRPLTLSVNPLPLVAGRYGLNVEYVVRPHHAIVGSGFLQTFPAGMVNLLVPSGAEIAERPSSMPGGEIGYRVYTSRESASGLFAGPSLVLMPIAYPRLRDDLRVDVRSLHAYGVAVDVG